MEATAEALATEPVAETLDEDAALGAIFDSSQEIEDQTPSEPANEADEPEPAAEEPSEPEAPSELPHTVRAHWASMTPDAREAVLTSQREISRKMGDQGRIIQRLSPIDSALQEAAKTIPGMGDLPPEQVAKEIASLAQVSASFNADPVKATMGLIKQHGLAQAIQAQLGGADAPEDARVISNLRQELAQMKQKIAAVASPEKMREQFSQFSVEAQTERDVTNFASTAEHWDKVEAYMPQAIQFMQAKLGQGASPKDVLTDAYELAVKQFVPEAKATPEAAAQAAESVNPEKAAKAIKAKSVNVTGSATGKSRKMTEDEALAEIWARNQS